MTGAASPKRLELVPARAVPRRLEDLPAPRALPWLGNLHQLDAKRLHAQLEAWAAKLGSSYTFKFGSRPVFVTSDVDIALSALRDRPGRFRRLATIEPVTAEMGVNGLFSVEGDAWRQQRNIVARALAPHQLESFFPTLQAITDRLRRRWQQSADAATEANILDDLTRFTVDTTATLVFGKDINTLESDGDVIQRHIGVIFPKINSRVSAFLPYWRFFKLPSDRKLDQSLDAVRAFAEDMIRHARERMLRSHGEAPRNILEVMLALRDAPESGFSDDDVYANIMTLLLAGEDTTAYSIAWAMHILGTDRDLQVRLHKAALDALGDARIPRTFADAAKLGLFEGAAFEAMRLRPVAPLLTLQAKEDVELGGIAIPRGTPVFLLTRPAALDDSNYQHAREFRPERWVGRREGGRDGHNARAFMQFGAGPRFCPGRYLATLEMKMVLAMLFRSFCIEHVDDPESTKEIFAFTMMPHRLRMRFRAIA